MDPIALQDSWLIIGALLLGAYLLGSISSAILVCRLFGLPDPRTGGSNNPGATNVLRLGGRPAAALTLAGDVFKGVIPVLTALYLQLGPFWAACAGFAAFLGHLLPIFFHFQGGKGVATAFGVIFALYWPMGISTGVLWLLVFVPLRISSLASMVAFLTLPIIALHWQPNAFWPLLVMSLTLLARHHQNIRKLLNGEELGFRKKE